MSVNIVVLLLPVGQVYETILQHSSNKCEQQCSLESSYVIVRDRLGVDVLADGVVPVVHHVVVGVVIPGQTSHVTL